MRANPGISLRIARQAVLLGIVLALSACEKPKLRSDGSKETVGSTPAEQPVNPFSPPGRPAQTSEEIATGADSYTSSPGRESRETPPVSSPLDPDARAREYVRLQKILDAQLAGIRVIESDLARHSAVLSQLRSQLQVVRARQAGAGSGGIRVERVGGQSTLVNRAAEARALEAKIKAEEPHVAQLSKALQEARQQFATLQRSVEQLVSE